MEWKLVPIASALGEERSQIETVSTRLELIRSFTGDNTSSWFALVVNLARRSSLENQIFHEEDIGVEFSTSFVFLLLLNMLSAIVDFASLIVTS
ncbi:hypothetical protein CEXT_241771 [Caerostris extrusa]|uniref:Uncharacterized protein n=1 Tax=Caerostris extrusa TaxID=172846 RepID=A0AAV4SJY7_CAEEX|nr:hypothetical protein CEXT_241771 [Caerostris extrusa]